MVAIAMQTSAALVRAPTALAARRQARRAQVVVRATPEEETPADGTFFYKGKAMSKSEWEKAVADGSVNQAAPTPSYAAESASASPSIGKLMAFDGPAPELINGRLAMLAFVAALGAELSSGQGVVKQLSEEPTGVLLTAIIFAAASLIPLLNSTKREAVGPFSPGAEMLNGRAAMIGFASLLVVEAVRGGAALF